METGITFFIPNTGNSDNNNQELAIQAEIFRGSGGSTDSDNPEGQIHRWLQTIREDRISPIPTPPEPTPEQPTSTPDPDDDRYGTDYNSPEHVKPIIPIRLRIKTKRSQ